MNIEDIRRGDVPPQTPTRREPATEDWWNVNSGLNLSTFGYPDNFENGFPLLLMFYLDKNVKKILEVGLTLKFQPFRGYTKPLAHNHDVTIPNHTHSVTVPNHTHSVTVPNHTHSISSSTTNEDGETSHGHAIDCQANTVTTGYAVEAVYIDNEGCSTVGTRRTYALRIIDTSLGANEAAYVKVGYACSKHSHTINSTATASGGGTTVTSASGGGTTVTSASGGGSTETSTDESGAEYGIFEDTYPANVSVFLDGVDITNNILGGTVTPTALLNTYPNLDLTPFVSEGGLHILELRTTGRGRCVPLLWVKSIITR